MKTHLKSILYTTLSFTFFSIVMLMPLQSVSAVDDSGTVKTWYKISDTVGGFTGNLSDEDSFGQAIADIGDIDGDSWPEFAAGASMDDDGGNNTGAIWISSINADGSVKSARKISATQGGFNGELNNNDRFGSSLVGLGDIDGDGVEDIAVGAPLDDDGSKDRGAIWILFLNAGGTVKTHQKISATQGHLAALNDKSNKVKHFGASIASLGDFDRDGIVDIVVGAPDSGKGKKGAVWMLFLNADGTVKAHNKIGPDAGNFTGVLKNKDHFGASVTLIRDLDRDSNNGIKELVVGANGDDDGGKDKGAVWVLFLDDKGNVKTQQKISSSAGKFTGELNKGDQFGSSLTEYRDINGDGIADIVVGSFQDKGKKSDPGAVWVLFLKRDGTVLGHQKISQHQGGFTGELEANDHFGASLATFIDLDRDGLKELIVGASFDDDGGNNKGALWGISLNAPALPQMKPYLFFMQPNRVGATADHEFTIQWTDNDIDDNATISLYYDSDDHGEDGTLIVAGLSEDEDGDNDNYLWNTAALPESEYFVYSVIDDGFNLPVVKYSSGVVKIDHNQLPPVNPGSVKSHVKISYDSGNFAGPLPNEEHFGDAVAGIGDLDGDGNNDIVVGTRQDTDGGAALSARGAVWILFLNADGTTKTHQKISDIAGGFTGGIKDRNYFGYSVSSIGDLNKDGTTDIAVGAILDDDGGSARGAIWVLFLNQDGTVKRHQKISDTQGGFDGQLEASDRFGSSIANIGDINQDGITDLLVGASGDDDGGAGKGALWLLLMNIDGTVKSQQKISSTDGGFTGELNFYDAFGSSLTTIGDLDKDGMVDIAVGIPGSNDGGSQKGAIWVLFLNTNGTVKSSQKISALYGGFSGLLDDADHFGYSITSLQDLDADGNDEIVVGALDDDDNGPEKGAVWVIFPNSDGTVKAFQKISDAAGELTQKIDYYDRFGSAVSAIGDINGDGIADLAVGARGDEPNRVLNTGAVWILHLKGEVSP